MVVGVNVEWRQDVGNKKWKLKDFMNKGTEIGRQWG
jgi:hypothetical protein